MERPVIYLAAPASPCRRMLEALGCGGTAELRALVQGAVGADYRVEGEARFIEADEQDRDAGRSDDADRAAALQQQLADEQTVALVTLRGGAWLTRVLPRIDFSVLRRRRRRLALFGFSELTTLLNIAAEYPQAFCVHDLGPGFIRAGLRDAGRLTDEEVDRRFREEFAAFFRDVRDILEGRGSCRRVTGTLVAGVLERPCEARFIGGNLAVFTTLLGTPYQRAVDPAGRWLVLEDINESPERIDRRLAHLKLAGFFERCAGLLIGDFHDQEGDCAAAVEHLLLYHLPPGRNLPVLRTRDVGHIWPLAPLPLNVPIRLETDGGPERAARVQFHVAWPTLVAAAAAPPH